LSSSLVHTYTLLVGRIGCLLYCITAVFRGCIQRESLGMEPYLLELTITSPYLIVDYKVHLSTPTTTNANKIIHQLMEQPIEKGEYEEGERKGWELTVCLRNFWENGHWTTPCLS
jgi:hypothetical protein